MANIKIPEYNHAELYPNHKCLSSSQVLRYEEDPARFFMEYVLAVRKPPSKAMLTGSIFHAYYEDRTFDVRGALKQVGAVKRLADHFIEVMRLFPVLPKECIEYPLKCEYRGWTFRATLDSYIKQQMDNIENKTGQVPWSQYRANTADQITFQNWAHWKKFGVPFRKTYLNWVSTEANPKQNIETFVTMRTVKQLREFEKRIDAVIDGIEIKNFSNHIYS